MAGETHLNGTAHETAGLPALPECAWAPPLDRYRELVCRDSEAPESYHWAAAVAYVGQLVGRRVFHFYAGDIYLNFHFALIGPTGIKKSTPITLIPRLLGDLCREEKIQVLWGISTGEGLLRVFAEDEGVRCVVCLNELSSLFAKAKRDGNQAMNTTIMDLMDAMERVDLPTKTNPLTAHRPYMSLLSAATAESLENLVGDGEVYGGFLNRILTVAGEPGEAQPFPKRPDPGLTAAFADRLADILHRYHSPTEIALDPDGAAGMRWYDWYMPYYRRQQSGDMGPGMTALAQRQHTQVRRLAMFFATLRGAADIVDEDMERAITIVEQYCHPIAMRVLQPITVDAEKRLEGRIERAIKGKPLTRRDLAIRLGGRVKRFELDRTLGTLIRLGLVEEITDGMSPKVWLRWAE